VDAFVLQHDFARLKIQIQACSMEMPVAFPVLFVLYIGFSAAILCAHSGKEMLAAGLKQKAVSEGGDVPDAKLNHDICDKKCLQDYHIETFQFLEQDSFLDQESLFYTGDQVLILNHLTF
jgi:hypothetical protein